VANNNNYEVVIDRSSLKINPEICSMNYFELFEIPVSLQVDKNILAKKYVELQKKYHPDFFSQATEYEQAEALEQSSQVNKALKVLRNPAETIKYVLQLKGLLEEEEKYQLPPDFLMEVMELNEELSDDSQQQVHELEEAIYEPVKPIIENFDDSRTSTEDLLKVKEYYYKKKYLQRILDRIGG
jgi:molecular chaperone HscB